MSEAKQGSNESLISLNAADFFNLKNTRRIKAQAIINLSNRSYLPKIDDPRSDWVASVAVPAFTALAQEGVEAQDFCSIGTGAGLDALAAIEILKTRNIVITDLHQDVVYSARNNIINNSIVENKLTIHSYAGDLLAPIIGEGFKFDILYENLPNIPIEDSGELFNGQKSSTYIEKRNELMPDFVKRYLIALHYVALQQAYSLLKQGGQTLSSIGGRIPLEIIVRLGEELGYSSDILIYTWKKQSEPEEVVGGYAQWERQGLGPFRFYPAPVLEEVFEPSDVVSGERVQEIEQTLSGYEMSASEAFFSLSSELVIGHTVTVLRCVNLPVA